MVDVLDVLASCTPVRLDGVVHIALLLWRIADELPTFVVDQYGQHFFAPCAVNIAPFVCFQCLSGDLVAPLKEQLRVLAANEWNGEFGLTRIVEDEYQALPGTFGSFAFDADMTCVVGAFVLHVLDGWIAQRGCQADVFFFGLWPRRGQRNERVSGVGCIEHLNNSKKMD
eukprot:6365341-Prymnesium_polylepis.2